MDLRRLAQGWLGGRDATPAPGPARAGAARPPLLQPGDVIEVDGRPVRLAVNARARRVGLRLSASRAEVVATAPSIRRLSEAAAFATRQAAWITRHLDRLPAPQALAPGAVIEVLGQPCRLERAAMRISPRLIPATLAEPARLVASGDGAAFARAAERALRARARATLTERTQIHCERLGQPIPALALSDAGGRWGSCRAASPGRPASIRYSWRLVLTPPTVLDYVAAHECAHLVEANHGRRFWAVVERLYGDPATARAWLKRHGARLHAVGRVEP